MKRLAALLVSFLAACAGTKPTPLAVPPHDVTHPSHSPVAMIEADASAVHDAAEAYIFSERSTAAGIEEVRRLDNLARLGARRMQAHPSPTNIDAARRDVAALRDYLGTVR